MKKPFSFRYSVQADFDGGGTSGGSKKGLIWKVIGGGCLAIVLVGALLTGLGVFKAVSCCSDFADLAVLTEKAGQQGYEFAGELHEGDYGAAYEFLGEDKKASMTVREFEAEFEPWATHLQSNPPWPPSLAVREDDSFQDLMASKVMPFEIDFKPPEGGEGLLLRVVIRLEEGEDEDHLTSVDSWSYRTKYYDLQDDSFGQRARRFFDLFMEGELEESWKMVGLDTPLNERGREAYADLMEEYRGALGAGRSVVVSVEPWRDDQVRVVLERQASGGAKRVEVLLSKSSSIRELGPIEDVEAVQEVEEKEPVVDEVGEDVDDEDEQAPVED